jgi:glycosyltransferase involved in cell wall biosynthesis
MPPASVVLSIVSPVYGSPEMIEELVRRIEASVKPISEAYEIILVDDCGPGDAWRRITAQAAHNPRVRGLRLSRNFGQHHAITAGLECCRGEWVVVMDCDLQDQPEEIPALYHQARQGYDLVLASRIDRQDVWHKKLFSWLFYRLLSYLTGTRHDPAIANFGIYHRKVVNAVLAMRESIRYFPVMVRWVGFRSTVLPVVHAERSQGRSAYSRRRMFELALDIMLAYSEKPLRLIIKLGLAVELGAILLGLLMLGQRLLARSLVPPATGILLVVAFFSGLLLLALGAIGLYVGKTFEQVKNRPLFIVDEEAGPPANFG